jgi:hypothetical protein
VRLEHRIPKDSQPHRDPPTQEEAKTRLRRGADDTSTDAEVKAPSCSCVYGSVSRLDSVATHNAQVKDRIYRVTCGSVPKLGIKALS